MYYLVLLSFLLYLIGNMIIVINLGIIEINEWINKYINKYICDILLGNLIY